MSTHETSTISRGQLDDDHLPGASESIEVPESEVQKFRENFNESSRIDITWRELFLASASLAAWFLIFTGGTLIKTSDYIGMLSNPLKAHEMFSLTFVILLFWTITNIGFLSMLAAILGAFGNRTRFTTKLTDREARIVSHSEKVSINAREIYNFYASSIMRGFGVYVLVLSGLLVLATEALVSPDQGQYVRLAGMISVVSFYAGYDPEMIAGLLQRIENFIKPEIKGRA